MVARMKRRYGLCLRKALQPLLAPALTSGSAMVSKTYFPSGMYGVGEKNSKGFGVLCHPELVSGSQKEIPNQVRNDKKVKAAFTLAEVLITLGIIGVVAAMTIPTLVANYQKKATATRLKVTYAKFMQIKNLSQTEEKDYNGLGLKKCLMNNSNEDTKNNCEKFFVENYILPNMRVSRNYGYIKMSDYGFPNYKNLNGEYDSYGNLYYASEKYVLLLSDGSVVSLHAGGVYDSTNSYGLIIGIDINGNKGPNVVGKDLFFMAYYPESNTIDMLGMRHSSLTQADRDDLAEICYLGDTISSRWCGAVIKLDNWTISDDYPWN